MRTIAITICSTLSAVALLALPGFAQEVPNLADLGRDPALTSAFETMTKGRLLPAWRREGMVTSPAQKVRFDGRDWLVMAGCKPHHCAADQIAVIWSPETGAMHGVLSQTQAEGQQILHWLNIGGGAESIDGRTILFAALTGSLANHPQGFDYD
ncbi:Ivy family c-type lysozyme inhibitor [Paracoccus ravus]|uniref:Ivy family c-type lysozyme inhibitor n=1 Tax=Paracoccus ravus TaxID=2447760 RepID=UPI001FD6B65D|nr:Ivy family c-type lysozyme inhibitor [Paracoccus ravus]